MSSIFESERVDRSARPLKSSAQKLILLFPNLEWDLKRVGYSTDAVQYLAISMFTSLTIFIVTALVITTPIIFMDGLTESYIGIVISIIVGIFSFIYFINIPKYKIVKKRKQIDRYLGYMLKDMEIQLTSGIPLFDTLTNIARGGYGECSAVANDIIRDVQSGKSMTKALDDFGMLSPSEYLRRVLWQIVNAVKTGSNVTFALKSISSDIQLEKENKMRAYGRELNMWSLIYMILVIVLPSMGLTFMVILFSFLGSGMISEDFFWIILLAIILFQMMFISIIKSKRPDIS